MPRLTRLPHWTYALAETAWLSLLVVLPAAFTPDGGVAVEPVKASLLRYLAAVAGMTWAAGRLLGAEGTRRPIPRSAALAGLAWSVAISLSTLFSLNPALSFFGSYERGMGFLTLGMGPVLLLTGADLFADSRRRERAVTALLVGTLFPCAYALAQYLGWDPLRWIGVQGIVSSLGSPTLLAGYLVLVIPFAAYRMMLAGQAVRERPGLAPSARYALYLSLMFILAGVLVLTGIRGALLGLVAAAGTFALLVTRGNPLRLRLVGMAAAGALVGVMLGLVSLTTSGEVPRVLERFLDVVQPTGSAGVRLTVWQAAMPLPLQDPLRSLLGFGPDLQATVFERSQAIVQTAPSERWDRAHNLLVDTWVTMGALGIGALLLLLVTGARLLWSGLRNADARRDSLLAATVSAALAGHLVEQLFAFHGVVTGAWFWVLLAFGASFQPSSVQVVPPLRSRYARSGLTCLAAVFSLVALPVLTAPAVATELHGAALRAQNQGAHQSAALLAERAAAWAPSVEALPRLAAMRWQALGFRPQEMAGDVFLEQAESQLEEAARRDPFDPYAHLRLARHNLAWATRPADPERRAQLMARATEACARALMAGPFRSTIQQGCADVEARSGKVAGGN